MPYGESGIRVYEHLAFAGLPFHGMSNGKKMSVRHEPAAYPGFNFPLLYWAEGNVRDEGIFHAGAGTLSFFLTYDYIGLSGDVCYPCTVDTNPMLAYPINRSPGNRIYYWLALPPPPAMRIILI